jgi:hypothetical protein
LRGASIARVGRLLPHVGVIGHHRGAAFAVLLQPVKPGVGVGEHVLARGVEEVHPRRIEEVLGDAERAETSFRARG